MEWKSGNLPDIWKRFKRHVQLVFSYMLIWVGEKGRDVFSTWDISEEDSTSLEILYNKFEEYVTPKSNPVIARFLFYNKI